MSKKTDEYLSDIGLSFYDEFEKVLDAADIPPGSLVFDAASGSGRMTRVLFEKGYRTISGDIGLHKLNSLKSSPPFSGTTKVHWVQCDLYQPGLREQCLDNIVCANLLHEVKRPKDLLKELLRILSERGTFILMDFTQNGFNIIDRISRIRHGKGHTIRGSISSEEVSHFLKENLVHFKEIEFPLNWACVARCKRNARV